MDDRAKRFRAWDVLEGRQEIVSPETVLPEDDLVFFLLAASPSRHADPLVAFASAVLRLGARSDATGLAAFEDTEFGPHGKMIRHFQGLFHR